MNEFSTQLQNRIMRRIYIIYSLRRVFSPLMVKIYVALVLFWQLVARISVVNIFENSPGTADITGNATYILQAFAQTEGIVQVLSILGFVFIVWLGKDVVYQIYERIFYSARQDSRRLA